MAVSNNNHAAIVPDEMLLLSDVLITTTEEISPSAPRMRTANSDPRLPAHPANTAKEALASSFQTKMLEDKSNAVEQAKGSYVHHNATAAAPSSSLATQLLQRNKAVENSARNVAGTNTLDGTATIDELARVTQHVVMPQEIATTRWEQGMHRLDSFSTKWKPKAAKLRRGFARDIAKIVASPSNRKRLDRARRTLFVGTNNTGADKDKYDTRDDPFGGILVAVDLPSAYMRQPDAKNPFNQKAVVGYERLLTKLPPASCTIYGAGLDYQSAFETRLAGRTQCAIHTFDCTLTDPVRLERFLRHQQKSLRAEQVRLDNLHRSSKLRAGRPNLAYHPWCLGDLSTDEQQSSNDTATNADRKKAYDAGAVDTANTFTLDTVMTNLGHKSDEEDTGGGVDLLKFDIEGYEWQLFGMLLDESITDPTTLPM